MFLLRVKSVHGKDPRYQHQVREWQTFLKAQGHNIIVDGDYGKNTDKATRAFQKKHGLKEDGLAGEQTFREADKHGFKSGLNPPEVEVIEGTELAQVKGIENCSTEFKKAVIAMAGRLGTDPNFLMAVMSFETGHTFSPSVKSRSGSGATGLIQFMPKTAKGLGTTTAKLAKMTAVEQLKFVGAHFKPFRDRMKTIEDCYMAVLLPKAVGKPNNFQLFIRGTTAYKQNRGLDRDGDGVITKEEAAAKVSVLLQGVESLPVELGMADEVVLQRGDKGAEVDEFQKMLVQLGFLPIRQYRTGPGIFGSKTEAAVQEFQHEHDIDTTGSVTLATRMALKKAVAEAPPEEQVDPKAIATRLPAKGVGFRTYNREPGGRDQFGRKEVIDAMIFLGKKWNELHPECPMQIGDISRKGGGPFSPHHSHRFGNDVDLRPFRKDHRMLPENVQSQTYSHKLSKAFIELVKLEFPKTSIFFNDPKVVKAGLSRHVKGHHNHIHLRFL